MIPPLFLFKFRTFVFLWVCGLCAGFPYEAFSSGDSPSAISPVPGGGYLISGITRTIDYPQSFFLAKIQENGSPARDFGRDGKVSFDFVDGRDVTSVSHLVDSTSRILVACSGSGDGSGGLGYYAELHCFKSNGRHDSGFADRGVFRFQGDYDAKEVLLVTEGSEGKILIVATTRAAPSRAVLVRLDSNGIPDASFGTGGRMTVGFFFSDPESAIRLIDGRILLSSDSDGLQVVQQNGSVDPSFANPKQRLFQSKRAIAQQADGKILIGETLRTGPTPRARIHRLLPDGSPDTGFGSNGVVEPTTVFRFTNLVEASPGKIWILAQSLNSGNQSATWIHQMNSTGVLEEDFGAVDSRGGRHDLTNRFLPFLDHIKAALRLPSGKMLVLSNQATATYYDGYRVSRFTIEGDLDPSFAKGAVVIDSSFAMPLLSYLPIVRGEGLAGEYRVPVDRRARTFRAEKSRRKRYLIHAAECGVGAWNYVASIEESDAGAARVRMIYAGGGDLLAIEDDTAQYNLAMEGNLHHFRPYRTARLIVQIKRSPRGSGDSFADLILREEIQGASATLRFRIANPPRSQGAEHGGKRGPRVPQAL